MELAVILVWKLWTVYVPMFAARAILSYVIKIRELFKSTKLRHLKMSNLNLSRLGVLALSMSRNIATFFHVSLEIEFNALCFINYSITSLCSTYVVAAIGVATCFLQCFVEREPQEITRQMYTFWKGLETSNPNMHIEMTSAYSLNVCGEMSKTRIWLGSQVMPQKAPFFDVGLKPAISLE